MSWIWCECYEYECHLGVGDSSFAFKKAYASREKNSEIFVRLNVLL
jgi:hypothetical protein